MAYSGIHYGLKLAIQTKVLTLISGGKLAGIASGSVRVRRMPSFAGFVPPGGGGDLVYPGLIISYIDRERIVEASNKETDRGYPVLLTIAEYDPSIVSAREVAENDVADDRIAVWRNDLIDNFVTVGITSTDPAAEFHKCEIEPGPVIDWGKLATDKILLSSMVLRYTSRRQRA